MNTDNAATTESSDEQGLRRALTLAADRPPPADLAERLLDRPDFRRRNALIESPARRWTVIGVAAAAVAAVAIGITVIGNAARPAQVAGPDLATAASAASADGGSTTAPAPTSTAPAVDPLLTRGSYQPWANQTVPCDGTAPVENAAQRLLNPKADVTGAVVCWTSTEGLDNDGVWIMAGHHELTAAQTATLVTALSAKNVPIDPAGICDAMAVLVPDFTLTLADGSKVRPGVPGDGCHPTRAVAAALAVGSTGPYQAPVRQTWSQAMVLAGCAPADAYVDPFGAAGGTRGARPEAPTTGSSVCSYSISAGDPTKDPAAGTTSLTATGAATVADVRALFEAMVKPGPGCTGAEAAAAPAAGGWLTVVQPPKAPVTADEAAAVPVIATVELGGCHRVLGTDGLAGFAPGAAVNALAAKASDPVVLK